MDIDALQYIKLHRARIVIVIGNQTALVQFGMQLLIGCSGIFGVYMDVECSSRYKIRLRSAE